MENIVLAAHTSWLTSNSGLLFLDDLLPVVPKKKERVTSKVNLQIPPGWQSRGSTISQQPVDIDKTVIFLGRSLREIPTATTDAEIKIVSEGEWKFTDTDIRDFVAEIYREYRDMFGEPPNKRADVFLIHFPQNVGFGSWEADTRGSTVTVVSSDMAFRTQSIQRLHEQLRHELFHLWLPNAVNLAGHYDWFYEGFALYQSLKTGVALNRLRFEDFLDTLGRAYTFDSAFATRPSLIDASANRSTGGDADLYARGMIIAFLTDLELMRSSEGKTDIDDVLRRLYSKYHAAEPAVDGNKAVLDLIDSPLITRYVQGTEQIDLSNALKRAGIELIKNGPSFSFSVTSKPSRRQRELLDKLGYNNWRRSNVSPK